MTRIVLAVVLAAFVASGMSALGHGGQPMAIGMVPMTDIALVTGVQSCSPPIFC